MPSVEHNSTIYPGEGNPKFIYKVLDGQGNEIARIIWDGISPFNYKEVFGQDATLELVGPA